jgi:outer membrane biosynthesis protein TonB
MAMPALAFLGVAGLVLTALLFVADAELENSSSPAIVTSQRIGLPEPQYHNARRTRTYTPAPAPDMTSQAVLAAQPKSEPEHQATIPGEARAAQPKPEPEHKTTIPDEARAVRAEAPPKKMRVEASAKKARAEAPPPNNPETRPTTYQQTPFFDKFSIKDY